MKRKALIVFCFFLSFLILIAFPSVKAISREANVSDIALEDATTSSGLPDTAIGSLQDSLSAGYNIANNYVEAYFYFNFTHKPVNLIKAELSLNLIGKAFSGPELNLTICIIEDSWSEDTITWNNAPPKDLAMGYFIYNNEAGGIYKLDISSYVNGRDNISICVYMEMDNFVENDASITPSENYPMQEQAPQIIWTYIEDATISVSNPESSSKWLDSESYSINWTSQGQISHVRIELFKDIQPIINITGYHINNGSYLWSVPTYLNLTGNDYQVKISDFHDPNVFAYSDYFTINSPDEIPSIPGYPILLLIGLLLIYGVYTYKTKIKVNGV